jgi:CHAT domain-containing protein
MDLLSAQDLRVIYFATHGLSDNEDPEHNSFLALSKGHHLTISDIRRLHLDTGPLVILSACETGLGPVGPGSGVFNIASAWFAAGASQVVMSLWDVNDFATAELMAAFVDQLLDDKKLLGQLQYGLGAEFALARAIRAYKLKRGNPALWAAFVVYGFVSATKGRAEY